METPPPNRYRKYSSVSRLPIGYTLVPHADVAIKVVSRQQYGDEQQAHKYFEREVETLKVEDKHHATIRKRTYLGR